MSIALTNLVWWWRHRHDAPTLFTRVVVLHMRQTTDTGTLS